MGMTSIGVRPLLLFQYIDDLQMFLLRDSEHHFTPHANPTALIHSLNMYIITLLRNSMRISFSLYMHPHPLKMEKQIHEHQFVYYNHQLQNKYHVHNTLTTCNTLQGSDNDEGIICSTPRSKAHRQGRFTRIPNSRVARSPSLCSDMQHAFTQIDSCKPI